MTTVWKGGTPPSGTDAGDRLKAELERRIASQEWPVGYRLAGERTLASEFGVSRAVAAIAEGTLDGIGLCWPREVAPADVHLVATGKDGTVFEVAEGMATDLEARGVRVLYDDRRGVSPGVKFKDAELLGVPTIVVVGKGLASGVVELRDRRTGDRDEVAVGDAVTRVLAACQA